MGNEFARKNMWDSEYRPEQLFTRDYIMKKHPSLDVKLEYPQSKLELDGKPYRKCILDIAIPSRKIAIRLNGGYHFSSSRQGLKDEFQKEALSQAGWNVIDFDSHKMPNLFKQKYNGKTIESVEEEIESMLGDDLFG